MQLINPGQPQHMQSQPIYTQPMPQQPMPQQPIYQQPQPMPQQPMPQQPMPQQPMPQQPMPQQPMPQQPMRQPIYQQPQPMPQQPIYTQPQPTHAQPQVIYQPPVGSPLQPQASVPLRQPERHGSFASREQLASNVAAPEGGFSRRRGSTRVNQSVPPWGAPPVTTAVPVMDTNRIVIRKTTSVLPTELVHVVFSEAADAIDVIYPLGDSGYGGDETYANLRTVCEMTTSPVIQKVKVVNTIPRYNDNLDISVKDKDKKHAVKMLLLQLVNNGDYYGKNLDKKLTILLNSLVADTGIHVDSYCADLIDLYQAIDPKYTEIIVESIDTDILSRIDIVTPAEDSDTPDVDALEPDSTLILHTYETLCMLPLAASLSDLDQAYQTFDEIYKAKEGLVFLLTVDGKYMLTAEGLDSYVLTKL